MQITYKDLRAKEALILSLPMNEEEKAEANKSRLKYAMQMWLKRVAKACEEVKEKESAIYLDQAAEDEKTKCVLVDQHGITQYTKEGERKKRELLKELHTTVIEFEPYYFMDETRIETFDLFIIEELRGIFFPPINDAAL